MVDNWWLLGATGRGYEMTTFEFVISLKEINQNRHHRRDRRSEPSNISLEGARKPGECAKRPIVSDEDITLPTVLWQSASGAGACELPS